MIDERQREILVIAQEEAAEVIQEISKIFRFGIHEQHKDGMSHREKLETEVGDLLCMIDLMVQHDLISPEAVEQACHNKVAKLETYSNIYRKS